MYGFSGGCKGKDERGNQPFDKLRVKSFGNL